MKILIILFFIRFLVLAVGAQPAITVYNENFAVVREDVSLDLKSGVNNVSYSGVTAHLEPESVILRDPLGKVKLSIVEQSYQGDPVDQQRLLQLSEGQTIRFLKQVDDEEVIETGKIIRAPSTVTVKNRYGDLQQKTLEPIIEIDGELLTELPGKPLFPSNGDDFLLKPTLFWKLFSDKEAAVEAQLSYLTSGISWKSDYNLMLAEEGEGKNDRAKLIGWVSIENNTGKTFEEAKIKLIAGDVNKVESGPQGSFFSEDRMRGQGSFAKASPPQVKEKKFDAFHMYTLPLTTTLHDRETKQVEFVRAETVQTKKFFVYDGFSTDYPGGLNLNQNYGQNSQPDVAIYCELKNDKENGLGLLLPAGRIRFYQADEDGQLEFTGESTIDHVAKDETTRVYLGNAVDLVGKRTRTDFFKHPSRDLVQETFNIEIRNRGEDKVTVHIVEHLYRWSDWKILKSSQSFEKTDAQTIEFPVTVKPNKTETVTYTVTYTW